MASSSSSSSSSHHSKHYGISPEEVIPIKQTQTGPASLTPLTVFEVFERRVKESGKEKALCVKRDGVWQSWTYDDYHRDVIMAAKSLIKLGLEPFHSVCIIGFNSPEWFISDIAAIYAGGLAAGIYTTNAADACKHVLLQSRANVVICENEKQLEKIFAVKADLQLLKAVVQYSGNVSPAYKKLGVLDWFEFMRAGSELPEYEVTWRMKLHQPGTPCTAIFTSGTTGNAKGVLITHDNITWTASTLSTRLKLAKEHIISYLPLSHIAAQMVDIHGPIFFGGTVWFAQPDALKGSLRDTLLDVRPTMFLGVPRVWEKFEEAMKKAGAGAKGMKKKISVWAKKKGLEGGYAIQSRRKVPGGYGLANKLVFKKVRAALGLDRCHFAATAAAPIAKDTLDYFLSLGIPIFEVYGMSECTGPQNVSVPGLHKTGACGTLLPGTELKIANPDADGNGEVCFRGRHIFMGYMFEDEKTKEAIDEEGWLHSGDVGSLDSEGFLTITGRIKELIITSGGENVPPVPIEDRLKAAGPVISNCMVIGDKRKFLSVLVSLKCVLDSEGGPTNDLAPEVIQVLQGLGSQSKTVAEAKDDAIVQKLIQEALNQANKLSVSQAQKVQKFALLPRDFSVGGGELGPTLKLRRPIVAKMYSELIESMYVGGSDA